MPDTNNQDWLSKLPPEARAKITPEVQQKLQEALSKMKNNPGLFGMMGALGGLNKIVKDNGGWKNIQNMGGVIDVKSTPSNETPTPTLGTPSSPAEAEKKYSANQNYNRQLNNQRNTSPTFNPDVKSDKTRLKLIIVGLLILGGYLAYKYGFNEQIPEELIEFFE